MPFDVHTVSFIDLSVVDRGAERPMYKSSSQCPRYAPTRKSKTVPKLYSSPSDLVAGEGDAATDGLEPGNAVELGVDCLDLPGVCLALGILPCEVGDTVHDIGAAERG